MTLRNLIPLASCFVIGIGSQAAFAQQRTDQPASRAIGQQVNQELRDFQIASCLITDNETEVALNRFAQEHAKSEQVRNFAKQMVEQHEQFIAKLHQAGFGVSAQPQAPREPQNAGAAAAGRLAQTLPGINFLEMKREFNSRMEKMVKQELQKKEGPQFDKAFIGQQIMQHMAMLTALETAEQYASPKLQKLISQGKTTTEKHLEMAQQIMRQLEPTATAQQPGGTPRTR